MTNIVYPTQCAVFFLKETSTIKESVLLTLPSNIGLVFGEILLMVFGTPLGHWYVSVHSELCMDGANIFSQEMDTYRLRRNHGRLRRLARSRRPKPQGHDDGLRVHIADGVRMGADAVDYFHTVWCPAGGARCFWWPGWGQSIW